MGEPRLSMDFLQAGDYKQYMQSYGGDYSKYMQGQGSQARSSKIEGPRSFTAREAELFVAQPGIC